MESVAFNELRERLQRERRQLVDLGSGNGEALQAITDTAQSEMEGSAQREREAISENTEARIRDIDAALARMEDGTYGLCANCGGEISEDRLRAEPATALCHRCAEERSRGETFASPGNETEELPQTGELPPDLEILDDHELADYLAELIRDDGRIDAHELRISAQNGLVYLEGALPSEPQHQMLLNLLTDIAGVQEIVDHLEIERLAWERADRSRDENAQEIPAGNLHDNEPYGGTEDVVLSKEAGVNYDPPDNPPPPHRKD